MKYSLFFGKWSDIHKLYDKDNVLDAKLRKASKLTFKALLLSDNKRNVNLAIAIFHETIFAACESCFSDSTDMFFNWYYASGQ